jgi:hypothetical protein
MKATLGRFALVTGYSRWSAARRRERLFDLPQEVLAGSKIDAVIGTSHAVVVI